jgi:IS605 OrfB family transposase
MTHTLTIETRINKDDLSAELDEALSFMARDFQQAKRAMFAQKMRGETINKPPFSKQYGLSSRQFNSVKQAVDAIVQSQITNLKRYIQEDLGRFDKTTKHLKRFQKQLKNHADNHTILSPLAHQKVVQRKRGCERRQQIITTRIEKRETLLKDGKVSTCFGSKDLFSQQYFLKENGFKKHSNWLEEFRGARSDEYYSKGAKDETNGNQSVCITQNSDGTHRLRVRTLNGLKDRLGQYLQIDNLKFTYKKACLDAAIESNNERVAQWKNNEHTCLKPRHQANIETLKVEQREQIERMQARGKSVSDINNVLIKQQKKLEKFKKETQNNLLCDFGQALSYRFKKDSKGWRVLISVPALGASETLSDRRLGAIGVDLNDKHLSVTYVSDKGNKVWSEDLYFRDDELISSKQTETRLAQAIKWITDQAVELSVPIYIEALDFKRSKAKKTSDKRFNKVVSSMITSKFSALITLRCFEKGILVESVDPAYTSFLGRLKYGHEFDHNTHQAAAMMIARRGMGLKDNRIPSVCKVKVKHVQRRFNTPEDVLKMDVVGQLSQLKRMFDSWYKQQYKAISLFHLAKPDEILTDIPY